MKNQSVQEYDTLMAPLFDEAERTGRWFYCSYQQLWFSPKELREENARGSFRWGPPNWSLRDPKELLMQVKIEVASAEGKLKGLTERLRKQGVAL